MPVYPSPLTDPLPAEAMRWVQRLPGHPMRAVCDTHTRRADLLRFVNGIHGILTEAPAGGWEQEFHEQNIARIEQLFDEREVARFMLRFSSTAESNMFYSDDAYRQAFQVYDDVVLTCSDSCQYHTTRTILTQWCAGTYTAQTHPMLAMWREVQQWLAACQSSVDLIRRGLVCPGPLPDAPYVDMMSQERYRFGAIVDGQEPAYHLMCMSRNSPEPHFVSSIREYFGARNNWYMRDSQGVVSSPLEYEYFSPNINQATELANRLARVEEEFEAERTDAKNTYEKLNADYDDLDKQHERLRLEAGALRLKADMHRTENSKLHTELGQEKAKHAQEMFKVRSLQEQLSSLQKQHTTVVNALANVAHVAQALQKSAEPPTKKRKVSLVSTGTNTTTA